MAELSRSSLKPGQFCLSQAEPQKADANFCALVAEMVLVAFTTLTRLASLMPKCSANVILWSVMLRNYSCLQRAISLEHRS